MLLGDKLVPVTFRKHMMLEMIDGGPRAQSKVACHGDFNGEDLEWFRGRRRKKRGTARSRSGTGIGSSSDDGRRIVNGRRANRSNQKLVGLMAYQSYIAVPEIFEPECHSSSQRARSRSRTRGRVDMILGSTYKLIMQPTSEYKTVENALTMLLMPSVGCEDVLKWVFKNKDVDAVVKTCRDYGLGAWSPLLVEDEEWDEEIERGKKSKGRWRGDDERWVDEHVEAGEAGWWSKIERSENRDWYRWRSLSIASRGGKKKIGDEEGGLEMDEDC